MTEKWLVPIEDEKFEDGYGYKYYGKNEEYEVRASPRLQELLEKEKAVEQREKGDYLLNNIPLELSEKIHKEIQKNKIKG